MSRFNIQNRWYTETGAISEGAFAYVTRVQDQDSGYQYALKKIQKTRGRESQVVIDREVSILGMLGQHPHICAFYGRLRG